MSTTRVAIGLRSRDGRVRGASARGAIRLTAAVGATAAFVLLWQLSVDAGWVSGSAVASPSSIVEAAWPLLTSAEYWTAIASTLRSWGEGLGISLVIAIPAGLLLGSSSLAYILSRFSVDFLRTIPAVALVPLALLIYGATDQMAVVLIVFGSIWPILLQTMYGVHQVDHVARDFARAYRLRRRDVIFALVIPSAAPVIATGIRIAATMSLLLAVGAELIGGAPGLGAQIGLSQTYGQIPAMWVYVVTSALLGVLLNLALLEIEKHALGWYFAQRSVMR